MERPWSVENLIEFIVDSARRGRADSTPFHHLQFDHVFPDDFYSAMLQAMPASEDYRAMSGKTRVASSRPDGKPTRAKIDLFPEYLRHLSSEKRAIWDVVGQALRSKELGRVFMERLAPGLQRRFGANFARVRLYPVRILTRDIPGYRVFKHTDSLWKGITVQLYLPPDNSINHHGTIFSQGLPDGQKPPRKQMPFARNTGYAFAVADNTWNSADKVGPDGAIRAGTLTLYFVDWQASRSFR